MDYFIITITTVSGLGLHAWLFLRIRRWIERDQALSLAGDDPDRRHWMLERLQEARRLRIRHKDIPAWLAAQETAAKG